MNQKLGKGYKLCSKKKMESIYAAKKTVRQYPFVINYAFAEKQDVMPFELVFSVPKRIFKKAHDRNRIKRLMRELIRKKKLILEDYLQKEQQSVAFFLIYTVPEEFTYQQLDAKMDKLLNKLLEDFKKNKHDDSL